MAGLDLLIDRLHAEGRLRLWSLVATFFGDAVAPRGGSIAMADLSALLERIGAEPGAIRTAMSRLARDGWVDREKSGRRSYYRLAGDAAAASRAAATRIYAAAPPEWSGAWTVAITAEPDAEAFDGFDAFHQLAPTIWIAPMDAPAPESAFVIRGGRGDAPDWARALLSPAPLAARYADLTATLRTIDFEEMSSPLDAIAARTLIIHDWRRILLRDAPLPRALRPAGWPGAEARDAVAAAYRSLAASSEAWLDGCESGPNTALPQPSTDFTARFSSL